MIFDAQVEFVDGAATHKVIMSEVKKKVKPFHKANAVRMANGLITSMPTPSLGSSISVDRKPIKSRSSKGGWFARFGVKMGMLANPNEGNLNLPVYHEFGGYGNRAEQGDFGRKRVSEAQRAVKGRRYYRNKNGMKHYTDKKGKPFKGKQFLAGWIEKNTRMLGNAVGSIYKTAFFQTPWLMIKEGERIKKAAAAKARKAARNG